MTDIPNPLSILVIDDEEIIREVIGQLLQREGYEVSTVTNGEEGLELAKGQSFDLVLLDLMLPGMGGMETLSEFVENYPETVVIMLTAYASIQTAVSATKKGAFDFVTKPFKNDELLLIIKNGLEKQKLVQENQQLKKTLRTQASFQNIIGKSEKMHQLFELVSQVGPRSTTVMITGETGTGKELIAKAIHNCSNRSDKTFLSVNSGTIPFDLIESELFGHVLGAFTGATRNKKGLFEVANGGTIFLDEIGNLPLEMQSKLLRVLQEKEFRQVGGVENIKVDVRIVAATNINLREAVKKGDFREDLYYRLSVITLSLPPLRERKEDIPLLAEHFISQFCAENTSEFCSLNQDALRALIEYDWPGNVRELENVMERSVILAPEDRIIRKELFPPESLGTYTKTSLFDLEKDGVSLKDLVSEFEKNLIVTALEKTNWNQKKAAGLLRMKATTLNEKVKRMNLKYP